MTVRCTCQIEFGVAQVAKGRGRTPKRPRARGLGSLERRLSWQEKEAIAQDRCARWFGKAESQGGGEAIVASTDGLRVIKPADRVQDKSSGAMAREAAVSRALVGAEKIWVGFVALPAGASSAAHHHGEAESVIYIISGRARFYAGDDLKTVSEAEAGDFIWVPPHVVHVEANASAAEPVRMVVVRSTQEALVFNDDGSADRTTRITGSRASS